jgi:hypothetical protein
MNDDNSPPKQVQVIEKSTDSTNLSPDEIDELHFLTRPRTHKLELRKWLYKNDDGSIPKNQFHDAKLKLN